MSPRVDEALSRFLVRWVSAAHRRAGWVIAFAVVSSVAVLAYTLDTLGMSTDTTDMIAEDLPFRQAMKAHDQAFPQFVDTLLVVVDGETADLAEDSANGLAARLEQRHDIVKTVYRPGGGEFFETHGLLYLDIEELANLADNLAEVQPLIAALGQDPSLRGLFAELQLAIDEMRDGADPSFDLPKAFDRLSESLEAFVAGRSHSLSWREVITGKTSTPADRRQFILVQPRLDFRTLEPQAEVIETVRTLAEELGYTAANGVRVRMTGSVALNYEQLQSARRGAEIAAPLSFVLVALVLFAGMRSIRLVVASLTTLIIGLIWTAGFAAFAIGELNLVSVAFAVLFIGLGIDFSIHMCLRYRELIALSQPHEEAVAGAGREVGRALLLCAATTAAGFYVFIPTDYAGVSELGLISGTGMFISLIANLTVLPAMLRLAPMRPGTVAARKSVTQGRMARIFDAPARHPRTVRLCAAALFAGSILTLPQARFDFNPLELHDPTAESVTTLRDLLSDGGSSPWSLDVLVTNLAQARELAKRLGELPEVDDAITIDNYLPAEQDDKLAIVEEIAFFMGPPPAPEHTLPPPDEGERRAALGQFAAALSAWLAEGGVATTIDPSARRLAMSLDRVAASGVPLDGLEQSLLASFPERLRRLHASLGVVDPITFEDLPESLVEREIATDGGISVHVFPREDIADNAALRRFVTAVRAVAPDAVGNPVSILESGDAVVRAFLQALASAIAVIAILLFVLLRRIVDTALVLVPLLLAASLTVAASVLLALPFNFANVIVLPLLLGIGVDSAIHLVHRHRSDPSEQGKLLRTSTARAVVVSALTTMCSFGSLVISTHRGTASMGELLMIGIGFTLICTLVVLPSFLGASKQNA